MDHYQYDPNANNNGNNGDNNGNTNGNNNWNNGNNRNSRNSVDKLALASLIFAVLAVPGLITLWLGIIFAVAAIVLAILSRLNVGRFEGLAAAGLTIGVIILILSLIIFIAFLQILSNPESVKELVDYMKEYTNSIQ